MLLNFEVKHVGNYLCDESVGIADVEPLARLGDVEAVPFRFRFGINIRSYRFDGSLFQGSR